MKRSLILLLIAIAGGTCFASFSSDDAGTSGAQFLKLGSGARAAAMGGAFTAVPGDPNAACWNPAGLNSAQSRSLSLMQASWFQDISYQWAAYVQPLKTVTLGAAVQYLSYGSIKQLDASGTEGSSFSPADMAVTVSAAKKLFGVDMGLNLKYISSKILNTATAYAADLGAQYKFCPKLTGGLVVQNIGTKIKFDTEDDPLPLNVKIGAFYRIRDNWSAALDLNAPIDNAVYAAVGTEYTREVGKSFILAGRAGYSSNPRDLGGLSGMSLGFGAAYRGYDLDYAYVPFGDLGITNRVSLSFKF